MTADERTDVAALREATCEKRKCRCLNEVHAHNIGTANYSGTDDRIDAGWSTPTCADCGHYGWNPPADKARNPVIPSEKSPFTGRYK